jgi:putative SOS response-associated peptidase YedK
LPYSGAFGLYFSFQSIKDHFSVSYSGSFSPRYNIRPSQEVPNILNTIPDELSPAVWGFDLHFGDKKFFVFNSRKESLEKPYARKLFYEQRFLIPASGFHECSKNGSKKIPHLFQLKSHEPQSQAPRRVSDARVAPLIRRVVHATRSVIW